MTEVRWPDVEFVFCDVGNILLDEDPLAFFVFKRHAEAVARLHPDVSFQDLLAAREVRALAGSRWPLFEAVSGYVREDECERIWSVVDREVRVRFAELSPLVAGACEFVDRLAGRFRLGLIANQGAECRVWLGKLGLLKRFEVVALSEEQGLHKPSSALFERALELAGVSAERSMMIGDRLDKDIEPAAALNMNTIWVRWPRRAAKGWQPPDAFAREFLASLERIMRNDESLLRDVRPSLVVETVEEIIPLRK